MRVIIKPMGFAMILISFIVLSLLVFVPRLGKPEAAGGRKTKQLGISLIPQNPERWNFVQTIPDAGSISETTLSKGPVGIPKGLKVDVEKADPAKSWQVQAVRVLPESFAKGQRLDITFWARSARMKSMRLVFEENHEPYKKELEKDVKLTPEWQKYSYPFTLTRPFKPMEAQIGFQVGQSKGDFEFTGAELALR